TLAGLAFGLRDRPEVPSPPAGLRTTRRVLAAAVLGTGGALAFVLVGHHAFRVIHMHPPRPLRLFLVLLVLILARIVVEGWWAARRGEPGRLGDDELRWVVLFLMTLFFLLSLGPVILYGRRPLGDGLYSYLYPYLLPLHAMRVYCRIGIIVVLGVALLAGGGARGLQGRLPRGRPWPPLVPALLLLSMLAGDPAFPLPHPRFGCERPP